MVTPLRGDCNRDLAVGGAHHSQKQRPTERSSHRDHTKKTVNTAGGGSGQHASYHPRDSKDSTTTPNKNAKDQKKYGDTTTPTYNHHHHRGGHHPTNSNKKGTRHSSKNTTTNTGNRNSGHSRRQRGNGGGNTQGKAHGDSNATDNNNNNNTPASKTTSQTHWCSSATKDNNNSSKYDSTSKAIPDTCRCNNTNTSNKNSSKSKRSEAARNGCGQARTPDENMITTRGTELTTRATVAATTAAETAMAAAKTAATTKPKTSANMKTATTTVTKAAQMTVLTTLTATTTIHTKAALTDDTSVATVATATDTDTDNAPDMTTEGTTAMGANTGDTTTAATESDELDDDGDESTPGDTGLFIDSQNVHGVGRAGVRFGKLVEIRRNMRAGGAYATLLQETHLCGRRRYDFRDGSVLITNGREEEANTRGNDPHWCGNGGVGILLSHEAAKAWRESGSRVDRYGERIIAISSSVRVPGRKKRMHVRLVSSYAPVVATHTSDQRGDHVKKLAECTRRTRQCETLIIGTDTNVRLGTSNDDANATTVGPHGISADGNSQQHQLAARKLHDVLAKNGLCAASTFYRSDTYTTYVASNGRELQLDHIIIRKRDLQKFRWVGATKHEATHSDHRRVRAVLRASHAKRQLPRRTRPDLRVLADPTDPAHTTFINSVTAAWGETGVTTQHPTAATLGLAHEAIRAAVAALPRVDAGHKGWTDEAWLTIKTLARGVDRARRKRDRARRSGPAADLSTTTRGLKDARHAHALHTRAALNAHTRELCGQLNKGGLHDLTRSHTAEAWKLARRLVQTPHEKAQRREMRLRDPETGQVATSVADSARIFCEHVSATLSTPAVVDTAAISNLTQQPIMHHLSNAPLKAEIDRAVAKLRTARAEGEAKVPIAALKALYRDDRTRVTITNIISSPWTTGSYPGEHYQEGEAPGPPRPRPLHSPCRQCVGAGGQHPCRAPVNDTLGTIYPEWQSALLTPAPKKGDIAAPANWRLLCVSEPLGAVFMSILEGRLQKALDASARDNQNGFRAGRGTTDAQFCVLQAIRQRANEGLHTWAVLVDLVKAFESLSLEACWAILAKLGVPPHAINLLRRFYDSFTMRLKLGPLLLHVIRVKRGIRTGGGEGPTIFNQAINVALDHVEWPAGGAPAYFGVRNMALTTDYDRYTFGSSEFADDAMALFTSRDTAAAGATAYDDSVSRFTGMHMHCAEAEGEQSKTVAICFPAPGTLLSTMDTTPLKVTRSDGTAGYINFVDSVTYLGMVLHHTADDGYTLTARIAAAAQMERSMRRLTSSRHVEALVKGNVIRATSLPVLLYTSELWCMNTRHLARLSSFWHRCCRRALRWTTAGMARRGKHMHHALAALGLKPITYYLRRRVLAWAGKVARMQPHRYVRRFMTSNACRPNIYTTTGAPDQGPGPHPHVPPRPPPPSVYAEHVGGGATANDGAAPPGGDDDDTEASGGETSRDNDNDNDPHHRGGGGDGDGGDRDEDDDDEEEDDDDDDDDGREHDDNDANPHIRADHAAPQRDAVRTPHSTRVEISRTSRARCATTGRTIQTGEIRFVRRLPALTPTGRAVDQYYSASGMAMLLARPINETLRRAMRQGVPGEDSLPMSSRELIRLVTSANAGTPDPIIEPTTAPWTCPRCRRHYRASIQWATAHARAGDCPVRREKPPRPLPQAAPLVAPKRHRNWLASAVHRHLRQEPQWWKKRWICRDCRLRSDGGPCDKCLFFQWGALAQDPAKWGALINGTHIAGGSDRRDRQHTSPPVTWVDPHNRAWATARRALGCWLDAPHAGAGGGPAWTTRLMPAGANAAVRTMAQLPPVDQLRLGAHVLVHAHTQDTKAAARQLLKLLAHDQSSFGQIPRTHRRHLWTLQDLKLLDQPTLFVPPPPNSHAQSRSTATEAGAAAAAATSAAAATAATAAAAAATAAEAAAAAATPTPAAPPAAAAAAAQQ